MKSLLYSPIAFLILKGVDAHYLFGRLIANNVITPQFEYVREIAPVYSGVDTTRTYPFYDVLSPDFRCNRNATTTGSKTKTVTVAAGSEIGFHVGDLSVSGGPASLRIFHVGPGSIWLSKAPGALETYEGDGDWFKIASVTSKPGGNYYDWYLYDMTSWNVTIPSTTPPGQYLLRIEHIYPRPDKRERPDQPLVPDTQFFISCAQIEITGEGGGTPGPLVRIPGVYQLHQADVFFDSSGMFDVTKYVAPYPPVWAG
ncbi:hypothetical protein CC78DRAFT_590702 [Lojkania enalia]|uniref:lytic cellulose monooxygenase (C4-dehydrogenating) n=1 Tax=Lojkania enalia TaxID=147567 RepID=A0A9P4K0Z5_9PLEO|nr:hypothetical protein CC78DRAFT_590702 [Didymosphaeria enalia]